MTYSLNIRLNICRSADSGAFSGIIDDFRHSIPGLFGVVMELPIGLSAGPIRGFVFWYADTLGASEGRIDCNMLFGINMRLVRHAEEGVSPTRRTHVPQLLPRVSDPPDLITEVIPALVNIQRGLRKNRIRCRCFMLGDSLIARERLGWSAITYREAIVRETNVKLLVGLGSARNSASAGCWSYGLARGTSVSVRYSAYLVRTRTVWIMGVVVKLCLSEILTQVTRSKKLSTMACNASSPGMSNTWRETWLTMVLLASRTRVLRSELSASIGWLTPSEVVGGMMFPGLEMRDGVSGSVSWVCLLSDLISPSSLYKEIVSKNQRSIWMKSDSVPFCVYVWWRSIEHWSLLGPARDGGKRQRKKTNLHWVYILTIKWEYR